MKKLFLFIIILTLSAGLWAQDSAITYTATTALPASDDEFDSPINLGLHIRVSLSKIKQSANLKLSVLWAKSKNGPALIVTDKDGKEIILYSPKKVEYIKVKEN